MTFFRGKFATVRRASHKTTGIRYAAKFIKKRRRAADQTKEIIHEIAVLLQVTFLDFCNLHSQIENTVISS